MNPLLELYNAGLTNPALVQQALKAKQDQDALRAIMAMRGAGLRDDQIMGLAAQAANADIGGYGMNLTNTTGDARLSAEVQRGAANQAYKLGRAGIAQQQNSDAWGRTMDAAQMAGKPGNIVSYLDLLSRSNTGVPLNNPILQNITPMFPTPAGPYDDQIGSFLGDDPEAFAHGGPMYTMHGGPKVIMDADSGEIDATMNENGGESLRDMPGPGMRVKPGKNKSLGTYRQSKIVKEARAHAPMAMARGGRMATRGRTPDWVVGNAPPRPRLPRDGGPIAPIGEPWNPGPLPKPGEPGYFTPMPTPPQPFRSPPPFWDPILPQPPAMRERIAAPGPTGGPNFAAPRRVRPPQPTPPQLNLPPQFTGAVAAPQPRRRRGMPGTARPMLPNFAGGGGWATLAKQVNAPKAASVYRGGASGGGGGGAATDYYGFGSNEAAMEYARAYDLIGPGDLGSNIYNGQYTPQDPNGPGGDPRYGPSTGTYNANAGSAPMGRGSYIRDRDGTLRAVANPDSTFQDQYSYVAPWDTPGSVNPYSGKVENRTYYGTVTPEQKAQLAAEMRTQDVNYRLGNMKTDNPERYRRLQENTYDYGVSWKNHPLQRALKEQLVHGSTGDFLSYSGDARSPGGVEDTGRYVASWDVSGNPIYAYPDPDRPGTFQTDRSLYASGRAPYDRSKIKPIWEGVQVGNKRGSQASNAPGWATQPRNTTLGQSLGGGKPSSGGGSAPPSGGGGGGGTPPSGGGNTSQAAAAKLLAAVKNNTLLTPEFISTLEAGKVPGLSTINARAFNSLPRTQQLALIGLWISSGQATDEQEIMDQFAKNEPAGVA
jgi:hypothetical protein